MKNPLLTVSILAGIFGFIFFTSPDIASALGKLWTIVLIGFFIYLMKL